MDPARVTRAPPGPMPRSSAAASALPCRPASTEPGRVAPPLSEQIHPAEYIGKRKSNSNSRGSPDPAGHTVLGEQQRDTSPDAACPTAFELKEKQRDTCPTSAATPVPAEHTVLSGHLRAAHQRHIHRRVCASLQRLHLRAAHQRHHRHVRSGHRVQGGATPQRQDHCRGVPVAFESKEKKHGRPAATTCLPRLPQLIPLPQLITVYSVMLASGTTGAATL